MEDETRNLSELLNVTEQQVFFIKQNFQNIYYALIELYHCRQFLQSMPEVFEKLKPILEPLDVKNRTYRLKNFSQDFTVEKVYNYQEYLTVLAKMEDKIKNPGSGYAANTMGKACFSEHKQIFERHYSLYSNIHLSYLL